MGEPVEATQAQIADVLAQRYGCLPAAILRSDAENLRLANTALLLTEKPRPAPPRQTPRERMVAEAIADERVKADARG